MGPNQSSSLQCQQIPSLVTIMGQETPPAYTKAAELLGLATLVDSLRVALRRAS